MSEWDIVLDATSQFRVHQFVCTLIDFDLILIVLFLFLIVFFISHWV